jgi:hypothetical protein
MPSERLELHISFRKLLMGMIILIVPMSILGWYITINSVSLLEQRNGAHFRLLARSVADSAAHLVEDRVAEVRRIALVPTVLKSVMDSNRSQGSTPGMQEETTSAERRIEQVLSSEASQFLQHLRDSRLSHVVVSDSQGAVVAATSKPLLANQREQWYWKSAFEGEESPAVSALQYEEKQQSAYVNVGVPIQDPQSKRVIGVVGAWVDVSDVLNQFWIPPLGTGSRLLLVNENGRVLSGPNMTPWLRLSSEEFSAVQEILRTLQGRESGYMLTNLKGGSRLIGFADTWPTRTYPRLNWTVLVSQGTAETNAPLRPVVRFALAMVVLSLLALIVTAVYFMLHREEPRTEVEIVHEHKPPEAAVA